MLILNTNLKSKQIIQMYIILILVFYGILNPLSPFFSYKKDQSSKDLKIQSSDPEIIIVSPLNGTLLEFPPTFIINFTVTNFDDLWVTVNYSDINYGYIASPGNNVLIDMPFSIWDLLPEGHYLVTIYVNNTAGDIDYDQIFIIKQILEQPSPKIDGYNLFILICLIFGVVTLRSRKTITRK